MDGQRRENIRTPRRENLVSSLRSKKRTPRRENLVSSLRSKKRTPRRENLVSSRRSEIKIGSEVEIVLKKDQRTGKLTRGIVSEILTSSAIHHRGIKVRLKDGQIGRVQKIYSVFPKINGQEYQEGLT